MPDKKTGLIMGNNRKYFFMGASLNKKMKNEMRTIRNRLIMVQEGRSSKEGLRKTLENKEKVYRMIGYCPGFKQSRLKEEADQMYAMLEGVDVNSLRDRDW